MNAPAVFQKEIAESRAGFRLHLSLGHATYEEFATVVLLSDLPLRGTRHYLRFVGNLLLTECSGWYEIVNAKFYGRVRGGCIGAVYARHLPEALFEVDEEERTCIIVPC